MDEIQSLFREAQERGLRTAAEGLLISFRAACQNAVGWHRQAGRALAQEGLDTDVLRREIEAWIERERSTLRGRLRALVQRSSIY